MTQSYDAILFVSFGGPESKDDVIPFLENVLRGKPVPRERMLEVAEHYYHFDGVSPINQQCRELIAALETELATADLRLPIYWGNRNWHPLLPDTIRQMQADGVRRVLAFVTSAFSSYSGCRQYRENISAALAEVGGDLQVDKIRAFFNHPDFIRVIVERIREQFAFLSAGQQHSYRIVFTAHSIPLSMAATSNYVVQLQESCRLVAAELGLAAEAWQLVCQSRSGRPQDPWLEPDICDALRLIREQGTECVIVCPIGFLSDHMEVLYDLDDEAQKVCDAVGLTMRRSATPGTHPLFVSMIRRLIQERLAGPERDCIGSLPACPDVCPIDCCPAPPRRPSA